MAFKKLISLAVLLTAALAVVGCGDVSTTNEEANVTAVGGDIEAGGVEQGEGIDEEIEGDVEEGGELGEIEVTGGAAGIEPTAELAPPDTMSDEDTTQPADTEDDTDAEEPVTSYETLAADLQERGVTVEELGQMENAPIGVAARTLSVNGEQVVLYQFEDADAAEAEAEAIMLGESEAQAELMLNPEAYVFQEGDVIVTYEGSDATVYGALAAVLGPELN